MAVLIEKVIVKGDYDNIKKNLPENKRIMMIYSNQRNILFPQAFKYEHFHEFQVMKSEEKECMLSEFTEGIWVATYPNFAVIYSPDRSLTKQECDDIIVGFQKPRITKVMD